MKEGNVTAQVATMDPKILPVTAYPTYVALLIPMGPGVIWDIATISVNCCAVTQAWFTTTSFCMRESIAYLPPKVKRPIIKNV
jgi:hypothetical protein